MEKKVGPSDFQAEIERLKAAGKLPSAEELLAAVGDARQKYSKKILDARKQEDARVEPHDPRGEAMAKLKAQGKTDKEAEQYLRNTPEPLW